MGQLRSVADVDNILTEKAQHGRPFSFPCQVRENLLFKRSYRLNYIIGRGIYSGQFAELGKGEKISR